MLLRSEQASPGAYSPINIGLHQHLPIPFQAEYLWSIPNVAGYNTASRDVTLMDVSTCDYWMWWIERPVHRLFR